MAPQKIREAVNFSFPFQKELFMSWFGLIDGRKNLFATETLCPSSIPERVEVDVVAVTM